MSATIRSHPPLFRVRHRALSMRHRLAAIGLCAAIAMPAAGRLGAQSVADVRGTVLLPDGSTPARGIVVLVLHALRDSTLARAVTGERGTFSARIGVESPDTRVRLRLLRLGHAPTTLGPYPAAAEPLRLVLADSPIRLARFDVRASRECRVHPDSGRLVAQLFEEARKVLLASVSTNAGVPDSARYALFSRVQDTRGRLVEPERRQELFGVATKPFASIGAEALARHGYVIESTDSSTFYAPDAEVLLSERFAATHCLFVVMGEGARRGSIGVGFRPERRRNGVVDIRGTLWLDSATVELQQIDYVYDPYPDEFTRAGVGGEVRFARTAAGSWLVSTWAIRMPRAVVHRIPRMTGAGFTSRTLVEGLIVTGGDLLSVRRQGTQLFASGASVAPAIADTTRQRQDSARTYPAGTLAGVRRDTSALRADADSATTGTLCGSGYPRGFEGSVRGRVADERGNGVSGITIVGEWLENFRRGVGDQWLWSAKRREGTSTAGGQFVLCGLPVGTSVAIFSTLGGRVSPTIDIRPLRETQLMLAHVGLPARTAATDVVRLRVRVLQENDAAVPEAEVAAEVARNTREGRTDSTGLVRLDGLSAGVVELRVRRVGFAPVRVQARLEGGDNELTVRLVGNAALLEEMRVIGNRRINGRLDDFEMRIRHRPASSYVTRAQIDRRNPVALTVMLRGLTGVHVIDSAGAKIAISSRGKQKAPGGLAMIDCPLRVSLDGNMLPPGYDLDAIPPVNVHGIEVYAGPASIPPQYQNLRSEGWCGLIMIWTRSGDSN